MNQFSHTSWSRRAFLRGAGGALIGLPFVGMTRRAMAKDAGVPERLLTIFHGNGIDPKLADRRFDGPLRPLRAFEDKLAIVRGLTSRVNAPGNGHIKGSAAFACGRSTNDEGTKGGATIDWLAHQHLKPGTPRATMSTGLLGGKTTKSRVRWLHSFRAKGQPNEPVLNARSLFDALFSGGPMMMQPDEEQLRRRRMRKSVLDGVLEDYRSVTSERAGFSGTERARIKEHLDSLRELEKRLMSEPGMMQASCSAPRRPDSLTALGNRSKDAWERTWPLISQVYAAGLRCDQFRFGNVMIFGGGDKWSRFNEVKHDDTHDAIFHVSSQKDNQARMIEWTMSRIAELLTLLDDPSTMDEEGRSILDRSLVMIGSELAQHESHSRSNMTFSVVGGQGVIQPGFHKTSGSDVDLYRTLLEAMNVPSKDAGSQEFFNRTLPIR